MRYLTSLDLKFLYVEWLKTTTTIREDFITIMSEIPIDTHSEGFKLITRVQDEAHRFAIEYHRSLRSKAQVSSVLDAIEGVGPVRRKALMKHFQDIDKIRNASVEELCRADGITETVAVNIYKYFH